MKAPAPPPLALRVQINPIFARLDDRPDLVRPSLRHDHHRLADQLADRRRHRRRIFDHRVRDISIRPVQGDERPRQLVIVALRRPDAKPRRRIARAQGRSGRLRHPLRHRLSRSVAVRGRVPRHAHPQVFDPPRVRRPDRQRSARHLHLRHERPRVGRDPRRIEVVVAVHRLRQRRRLDVAILAKRAVPRIDDRVVHQHQGEGCRRHRRPRVRVHRVHPQHGIFAGDLGDLNGEQFGHRAHPIPRSGRLSTRPMVAAPRVALADAVAVHGLSA